MWRGTRRGPLEVVISITVRSVITGGKWADALRQQWASAGGAWRGATLLIVEVWDRTGPGLRSEAFLRLTPVRGCSAWFAKQVDYVQGILIAFSLVGALLLSMAAEYIGRHPPAVLMAKAQEPTLATVLYDWLERRPALPSTTCEPFEPPALCAQRQAANAQKWQADFSAYLANVQGRQYYAVWTRTGKDFPTWDRESGGLSFGLALEGTAEADAQTCLPFRVTAFMPHGITTGRWPDQTDANAKPAGLAGALRSAGSRKPLGVIKTKSDPFPHPCLRTTEWTAWVRVEPETAQVWAARANDRGWKLEMYFRLGKAESPLLPNWDEDARLTDGDFLKEQRIWLWVDAVRLVIGDLVVHEWR